MPIIKTIKLSITSKLTRTKRHPVSKLQKQLEIIIKHQENMIKIDRVRTIPKLKVVRVKKYSKVRKTTRKRPVSLESMTVLCNL